MTRNEYKAAYHLYRLNTELYRKSHIKDDYRLYVQIKHDAALQDGYTPLNNRYFMYRCILGW